MSSPPHLQVAALPVLDEHVLLKQSLTRKVLKLSTLILYLVFAVFGI